MFEISTIISPISEDGKFDIARLLDAMLYYQKIEFLVDARAFCGLWDIMSADDVESLLTHPSIEAKITSEMPVVSNREIAGFEFHIPAFVTHRGNKQHPIDKKDTARSLAYAIAGDGFLHINSRVNKIVKRVGDTRYGKIFKDFDGVSYFKDLVSDRESLRIFLSAFAKSRNLNINKELLNIFESNSYFGENGYSLHSNVSLDDLFPNGGGVKWQNIMPFINDYEISLRFSQIRSSDIICDSVNSFVSSQRLDLSLMRALRSRDCQTAFEEFVFDGARPFGKAYAKGDISLKDALDTIDKTSKFREWLRGLPVDAEIVKEYHKAISKDTWLDKLPGKFARFSLFTGAGVFADIMMAGGLGTISGLSLSAIDSFVIDGIVRGWRPSNFVDDIEDTIRSSGK